MDPVQTPGGGAAPATETQKPVEGAPAYVTEEQLQSALTSRFRTFEQKLDKALADGLGGIGTRLRDELAALLPKPEARTDGGVPPTTDASAGGSAAPAPPSPELKKLQDQISVLTKQAEDARSERDAERARSRDAQLRQRVTEALSSVGIEGVRARHALGLLVDAERRVRWAEGGDDIVFRTDTHDDLDLSAGIREWLKTDDAKLYLPPRGAAGSGDRPGARPPATRPADQPDRTVVAEGLRRVLLGQL